MSVLFDRLKALTIRYCDFIPEDDRSEFIHLAEQVQVVRSSLLPVAVGTHWSGSEQSRLPLRGFVGEIALAGDLARFMPMLRAGEFLHDGVRTSFGQGHYAVVHQERNREQ